MVQINALLKVLDTFPRIVLIQVVSQTQRIINPPGAVITALYMEVMCLTSAHMPFIRILVGRVWGGREKMYDN